MTAESPPTEDRAFVPFIVTFAEALHHPPRHTVRYDAVRQIAQMFVDGAWIDAIDRKQDLETGTRMTRLPARETTDDV